MNKLKKGGINVFYTDKYGVILLKLVDFYKVEPKLAAVIMEHLEGMEVVAINVIKNKNKDIYKLCFDILTNTNKEIEIKYIKNFKDKICSIITSVSTTTPNGTRIDLEFECF